jgi:hypothetical protein
MESMTRRDWILILEVSTGLTHLARPDEKQKDRYVTLCGLSGDLMKRGQFARIKGFSKEDEATAMPTCDSCLSGSDSLLSDKDLGRVFDRMLKDTDDKKR